MNTSIQFGAIIKFPPNTKNKDLMRVAEIFQRKNPQNSGFAVTAIRQAMPSYVLTGEHLKLYEAFYEGQVPLLTKDVEFIA